MDSNIRMSRGGVQVTDGKRRSPLSFLRRYTLFSLAIVTLILVGFIDVLKPGTVSPGWATSILVSAAPLGLLAAGQTLVVLTGGIDLSVTSVATTSAYLVTSLVSHGNVFALVVALLVGVVVGLINGIGVAFFEAQPLIMTLGMSLVVDGALEIYHAVAVSNLPGVPAYVSLIGSGTIAGYIPYSLFVWIGIAFLIYFLLKRTGLGRAIYAVGDNEPALSLLGIRVWQIKLFTYLACGLLSAISGVVLVGVTSAPALGLADTFLLPSIAAVVVGGTSIFGGRGSYGGTFLGALILVVLDNVQVLLKAPEPVRDIVYGSIILLLTTIYVRFISQSR